MTTVNIVAWIVIGGVVGLLVSALGRRTTGGGLLLDLIVGLIGGFVGGVLLNAAGGIVGTEIAGISLAGAVVAIVGAVILVGLLEWLRGTQT